MSAYTFLSNTRFCVIKPNACCKDTSGLSSPLIYLSVLLFVCFWLLSTHGYLRKATTTVSIMIMQSPLPSSVVVVVVMCFCCCCCSPFSSISSSSSPSSWSCINTTFQRTQTNRNYLINFIFILLGNIYLPPQEKQKQTK